jgi:hypothetical protein
MIGRESRPTPLAVGPTNARFGNELGTIVDTNDLVRHVLASAGRQRRPDRVAAYFDRQASGREVIDHVMNNASETKSIDH